MGLLDLSFPKKMRSFVCHNEMLEFFQSYAGTFNLNRAIKFNNYVVRVRRDTNQWEVQMM